LRFNWFTAADPDVRDAGLMLRIRGPQVAIYHSQPRDEFVRRHRNRMAALTNLPLVKQVGRELLDSGAFLTQMAANLDAWATDLEREWNIGGVEFKEGPGGPTVRAVPRAVQGDRLNHARNCEAAAAWGFLLGAQGLALAFIPPLAPLALWYAAAALVADGYAVFFC